MVLAAMDQAALEAQFAKIFGSGGKLHRVRAPGRVNLVGEHTDYNDGFVLPMAIEPQVMIICRGRDDGKIRLASTQFTGPPVEFSVDQKLAPAEPKWANYCRGMVAELLAAGIPLVGMDALITSTLPVGGGLSSSAAIEIATGMALLALIDQPMEAQRLALIAQRAEQQFAGVPCGVMDQSIVAGGKAGHAMLLDCRDLTTQFIPIDAAAVKVVIINSMVRHELSGGEYAERRRQCEQGVAHFARSNSGIRALRDVTLTQLELAHGKIDETVYRRCRHVITENSRTLDFATQLTKQFYEPAGQAMLASHASLRDDFEVSCPELDFLVEQSMKIDGVYGARMTGGGFGGSIVALAQPAAVETLRAAVVPAFQKQFGKAPHVLVTTSTAGANVLA